MICGKIFTNKLDYLKSRVTDGPRHLSCMLANSEITSTQAEMLMKCSALNIELDKVEKKMKLMKERGITPKEVEDLKAIVPKLRETTDTLMETRNVLLVGPVPDINITKDLN